MGLPVSLLQHRAGIHVAAIENAAVAHFPNGPSREDHQGVQPFSSSLRRSVCNPPPPILGGGKLQRRSQVRQTDPLKDGRPYLSCENTRRENVLDCLILLVAKEGLVRVLESPAG